MTWDDIVIIPAFGTEVTTRKSWKPKVAGCGHDVRRRDSVWNGFGNIPDKVTSIIHGKPGTGNQAMAQAMASGGTIWWSSRWQRRIMSAITSFAAVTAEFLTKFKGAYSGGLIRTSICGDRRGHQTRAAKPRKCNGVSE
jgi:hypothetical protein